MNDPQKEYNKKLFESYMKWLASVSFGLHECSDEVREEFVKTAKFIEHAFI